MKLSTILILLFPLLAWADGTALHHDMHRLELARDLDGMQARLEQADDAELSAPEAFYWRSYVALIMQQNNLAEQILAEGLAAHPDSSLLVLQHSGRLSSGFDDVRAMGRLRLAREIRDGLRRAVELDPDSVPARTGLIMFYLNAPRVAGGGADRAEPHLARIRELSPMDYYELKAGLAMGQGEMTDALDWFDQATAADPEQRPRFSQALALMALERHEESRAVLSAITDRSPTHLAAWYQQGRLSVVAEDHLDEGLAALERFLAGPRWPGDPAPAAAWWRIGQLHQLKGDPAAARSAFEQALTEDPDFGPAAESLAELNAAGS